MLRSPHTQKKIRTNKGFQQVTRYKIQKSVAFLYTNNKISERESKNKKS